RNPHTDRRTRTGLESVRGILSSGLRVLAAVSRSAGRSEEGNGGGSTAGAVVATTHAAATVGDDHGLWSAKGVGTMRAGFPPGNLRGNDRHAKQGGKPSGVPELLDERTPGGHRSLLAGAGLRLFLLPSLEKTWERRRRRGILRRGGGRGPAR